MKNTWTLCLFQEASRKSLESGTTATIVLIVEGQILVANVGDSKAVLCSESHHSVCEYKGLLFLSCQDIKISPSDDVICNSLLG